MSRYGSRYSERPVRRQRPERRQFGQSWWGEAWVEAVEKRAHLEASRLPRGRMYARWGYVGELSVETGAITALVSGSRPEPYHTYVRVVPFTDEQWDALFDVVAGKVAHAAVLADGELSPQMVDDAAAAGVELLPTEGDITTGCSCFDSANPCKHAAAVCYLIADLLDDDPFVLLQMRGRTKTEVGEALRARRRPAVSVDNTVPVGEKGVDPRAAYANYTGTAPWPKVPKPHSRPGVPVLLPPDMPKHTDIDQSDLVSLATDAALRAWELCNGIGDGGLRLHWYADVVRRSVPLLDNPGLARMSRLAHVPLGQLEQDARLWRAGGEEAVEEANSSWSPDRQMLSPAVRVLEADAAVSVRQNRVTSNALGVQLRLGESGRWYRYEKVADVWRFTGIEAEPTPPRID